MNKIIKINLMYFVEEEVSNTTNPVLSTWAGWAVTTVTSKFYSSKNPQKDDKSIEISKSIYHLSICIIIIL